MIDRIPLLADDLFVALSSGDKKMGLLVIQELNFILKKHYNTRINALQVGSLTRRGLLCSVPTRSLFIQAPFNTRTSNEARDRSPFNRIA